MSSSISESCFTGSEVLKDDLSGSEVSEDLLKSCEFLGSGLYFTLVDFLSPSFLEQVDLVKLRDEDLEELPEDDD